MNNEELINEVEEILANRVEHGTSVSDGKWIVWKCALSAQTMAKFVGRVKSQTGQPAFFRSGKFGVLALMS